MIKSDLISGFVMLLVSIYVYISALSFPKSDYQLSGPAFYPQLMAILLGIVSITLIIRSVRSLKNNEHGEKVRINNPKKVIASMVATLIYVLILKTVGFLIATFIYLTVLILIMQPQKNKILISILVSFIMTGAVYFIFAVLFAASLPMGIFF